MNIPVTPFMWIMAVLPICLLLVLMVGLRWGAMKAAPLGVSVTVFTGMVFYKADLGLILVESAKGAWSAMIILIIVWTAVLLYQVGNEANAYRVIRNGMKRLLPNELLLVLALGWIFESFLQGITGFGVPVAVGAPLLIGLGVKPLWAVIIPLMGQSWGNTYGTLGAAWDALTMTSGMTVGSEQYLATAFFSAVLLWIWNAVIGLSICWFYGKGTGLKKGFPAVLVLSALQGGGELLMTQFNTTVACFIPACLSLLGILVLGRTGLYRDSWSLENSRIMEREQQTEQKSGEESSMSLLQAILPYILLSVITLVVLMVEPVKNILGYLKVCFSFPETVTGYGFVNEAVEQFSPLSPFTHASMFLLVSSLAGLFYYRSCGFIAEGGAKQVFKRTAKMALPSSIAVMALVIMSKIMSGTGQTVVLANGIAATLGNAYVALAPFIGMLGSFMTGSNMSSNILFGSFQTATAEILGVDSSFILGAQTAGGSIGSAISPSNIVLGTTTANILGREGDVLKRTGSIVIPVALLMGLIVFLCI